MGHAAYHLRYKRNGTKLSKYVVFGVSDCYGNIVTGVSAMMSTYVICFYIRLASYDKCLYKCACVAEISLIIFSAKCSVMMKIRSNVLCEYNSDVNLYYILVGY